MAKEQGAKSTQISPQEINIDDLEITILMLVKNPRSHESTVTFLSRRGWPTKAQSNLQKAINQIATDRPDFVLISLNFPHPALMKLIPIFKQTFDVEVVLFNEVQDASSVARLAQMDHFKITGAPSGPNLQRTLRRILQKKLNPTTLEDEMIAEKENDSSSTFRFSPSEHTTIQSATYTMESENISKKKKRLKDISSGNHSEMHKTSYGGPSLADLLNQIVENENKEKSFELDPLQDCEKYAPLHTAVLNGVEQICDKVFTDWTGIEPTSELFVLPVAHRDLHGYLVVKLDEPVRLARAAFFELISSVLQENIQETTEAHVDEGIEIGIPVIDFKEWVDKTALFKVASDYVGTKFCVAFLKTDKPLPEIKKMPKEKMLKISIEEISTLYPVTFKAYIRFEKNQKFFLYLKNGRRLLPEQKKRLEQNKISEICVKQIDEANLRKFFAFVQLRESMIEALKIAS